MGSQLCGGKKRRMTANHNQPNEDQKRAFKPSHIA
jgi:hypothetical protein